MANEMLNDAKNVIKALLKIPTTLSPRAMALQKNETFQTLFDERMDYDTWRTVKWDMNTRGNPLRTALKNQYHRLDIDDMNRNMSYDVLGPSWDEFMKYTDDEIREVLDARFSKNIARTSLYDLIYGKNRANGSKSALQKTALGESLGEFLEDVAGDVIMERPLKPGRVLRKTGGVVFGAGMLPVEASIDAAAQTARSIKAVASPILRRPEFTFDAQLNIRPGTRFIDENPEALYRVLGNEGYADAGEAGKLWHSKYRKPGYYGVFFTQGQIDKSYEGMRKNYGLAQYTWEHVDPNKVENYAVRHIPSQSTTDVYNLPEHWESINDTNYRHKTVPIALDDNNTFYKRLIIPDDLLKDDINLDNVFDEAKARHNLPQGTDLSYVEIDAPSKTRQSSSIMFNDIFDIMRKTSVGKPLPVSVILTPASIPTEALAWEEYKRDRRQNTFLNAADRNFPTEGTIDLGGFSPYDNPSIAEYKDRVPEFLQRKPGEIYSPHDRINEVLDFAKQEIVGTFTWPIHLANYLGNAQINTRQDHKAGWGYRQHTETNLMNQILGIQEAK